MQPEPWFEVGGPLPGTIEQRLEQWKTRFARPAASLAKQYDPWTYADLRHLAGALREQALAHGLTEIRIGTLVIGYKDLYGGASAWSERHPDAFVKGFNPTHHFTAPTAPCAAFPEANPAALVIGYSNDASAVEADAWIVQTPVSLTPQNRATLRRLIDSGQPIVLVPRVPGSGATRRVPAIKAWSAWTATSRASICAVSGTGAASGFA